MPARGAVAVRGLEWQRGGRDGGGNRLGFAEALSCELDCFLVRGHIATLLSGLIAGILLNRNGEFNKIRDAGKVVNPYNSAIHG